MIPKTIHYCWFGGGEKPKLAQKCIASWRELCPEYELVEWNESNFDLDRSGYARYCRDHRRWAFLSDYVRLAVVGAYGGIYLDTDVEVVRPLDPLLVHDAFFGFETSDYVSTGIGFGAVKGHPTVLAMLERYEKILPGPDGSYPLEGCPKLNTQALLPFGLQRNGRTQNLDGNITVYSPEFFSPYDDPTGRLRATENTYSIHWFAKSWMSKKTVLRSKLTKPLHRLLGTDFFRRNDKRE